MVEDEGELNILIVVKRGPDGPEVVFYDEWIGDDEVCEEEA